MKPFIQSIERANQTNLFLRQLKKKKKFFETSRVPYTYTSHFLPTKAYQKKKHID